MSWRLSAKLDHHARVGTGRENWNNGQYTMDEVLHNSMVHEVVDSGPRLAGAWRQWLTLESSESTSLKVCRFHGKGHAASISTKLGMQFEMDWTNERTER